MKIINPPGLPPPRGYSNGVVAEGRMLFVAGQIGWNESSRLVGDRFVDQFDQALANVLTVVKAAGGAPESVSRLTPGPGSVRVLPTGDRSPSASKR